MPAENLHRSLTIEEAQPDPQKDDVDEEELDDLSRQLEVTFSDNSNDNHRRKSSMTSSKQRPGVGQRTPSCLVHGILNDKRMINRNAEREPSIKGLNDRVDKDPHNDRNDDHNEHNEHSGMRSRLLTKKELSDMAFSIRELSSRLGRFKLKLNVRNVFLLTKAYDQSLVKLTRDMAEWLLDNKEGPYTVYVEETMQDNDKFDYKGLVADNKSRNERLKFWDNELCRKKPHIFDIVIALGGDGTVLYASWLFQRTVPPVVSFALGSLGFLTKFDFDNFKETLTSVFKEGITVSLRLRLEATVMRSQNKDKNDGDLVEELIGEEKEDQHTHKPEATHDILNDLVLDRGPNPTMSSIEVFGHNFHITTVQADGVVVATPTGSTAYNLAAGGSLCHPDNPVILVTAICAHTLSFRPIILPDTVVLRLGVPYDARASSWVSFDGRERVELNPGDYVTISASRFPFPTVMPIGKGNEDWIDSLSETLQWNLRKKQKSFQDGKGGNANNKNDQK